MSALRRIRALGAGSPISNSADTLYHDSRISGISLEQSVRSLAWRWWPAQDDLSVQPEKRSATFHFAHLVRRWTCAAMRPHPCVQEQSQSAHGGDQGLDLVQSPQPIIGSSPIAWFSGLPGRLQRSTICASGTVAPRHERRLVAVVQLGPLLPVRNFLFVSRPQTTGSPAPGGWQC